MSHDDPIRFPLHLVTSEPDPPGVVLDYDDLDNSGEAFAACVRSWCQAITGRGDVPGVTIRHAGRLVVTVEVAGDTPGWRRGG
jgi:hypothetical protein